MPYKSPNAYQIPNNAMGAVPSSPYAAFGLTAEEWWSLPEEERLRLQAQELMTPRYQRVEYGTPGGISGVGPSMYPTSSPQDTAMAQQMIGMAMALEDQQEKQAKERISREVLTRGRGGGSISVPALVDGRPATVSGQVGGAAPPMSEQDKWAASGGGYRNPDPYGYGIRADQQLSQDQMAVGITPYQALAEKQALMAKRSEAAQRLQEALMEADPKAPPSQYQASIAGELELLDQRIQLLDGVIYQQPGGGGENPADAASEVDALLGAGKQGGGAAAAVPAPAPAAPRQPSGPVPEKTGKLGFSGQGDPYPQYPRYFIGPNGETIDRIGLDPRLQEHLVRQFLQRKIQQAPEPGAPNLWQQGMNMLPDGHPIGNAMDWYGGLPEWLRGRMG